MFIREQFEKQEHNILCEMASFSDNTKGRLIQEELCDIRTEYQRDRDRILHSKSFRRLKHKTQVFLAPGGDHYRTRLTHTLEVSQIARTIARAIKVNEDLTEAIALGHDLGHTPFGHAGERALASYTTLNFKHNEQSVRVVDRLEKNGKGLNLTFEVKDGILNHKMSGNPSTLEGQIVRISDKLAYVNHDIDDGIRAGILKEDMLPKDCTEILGHTTANRINTLIHGIVRNSIGEPIVALPSELDIALKDLRKYMFEYLYTNPIAKSEEAKAEKIIGTLFEHYMMNLETMPMEYVQMIKNGEKTEVVVCDYIAGMTDNYAVTKATELLIPNSWNK